MLGPAELLRDLNGAYALSICLFRILRRPAGGWLERGGGPGDFDIDEDNVLRLDDENPDAGVDHDLGLIVAADPALEFADVAVAQVAFKVPAVEVGQVRGAVVSAAIREIGTAHLDFFVAELARRVAPVRRPQAFIVAKGHDEQRFRLILDLLDNGFPDLFAPIVRVQRALQRSAQVTVRVQSALAGPPQETVFGQPHPRPRSNPVVNKELAHCNLLAFCAI